MHRALGRNVPLVSRPVGHQSLMHGLRRDARVCHRSLELRICLALRFDQRMNLLHQFRAPLLALGTASCRVVLHTTNPGAEFVQSGIDRLSPPAKDPFGPTWTAVAILDGHLRLELPPPKSRQLPRRRPDGLPHRFRQFCQHRPVPETPSPLPLSHEAAFYQNPPFSGISVSADCPTSSLE